MGQILLTPEEIRKTASVFVKIKRIEDVEAILTANAKAQLKKILDRTDYVQGVVCLDITYEDWQALLKEVKQ